MALAVAASLLTSGFSAPPKEGSPIIKVVRLLRDMETDIIMDGKKELQSYNKHQCWCESTLARKAADISAAKEKTTKLQKKILKLKADVGAHGVEITQLEKDVAENKGQQEEASEVRGKEAEEYANKKAESEQCIGALEAAIKFLTGAGTKQGGFLSTIQQAQLVSVAADVGRVLQNSDNRFPTNELDLETIQRFVADPKSLSQGGRPGRASLSALQVRSPNPHGDYAPQSTQIQGILKGMYDSFVSDLEKSNAEEATKVKSFQDYTTTKEAEENTMKSNLDMQKDEKAKKSKDLADSKEDRDETMEQQKADEAFFEDAKESCKETAVAWSERSRLRTEELVGFREALGILTGPEAMKIFSRSQVTLVQISSSGHHAARRQGRPAGAYLQLRALASRRHSKALASLAATVRMGGHFDKVLSMIDQMIENLRAEEKDDIEHRERCQNGATKNGARLDDLAAEHEKLTEKLKMLADKAQEHLENVERLEGEIKSTKKELESRTELRNEEREQFEKALKDDIDSVALMKAAIGALKKFYDKNKKDFSLLVSRREPEYSEDPDVAPDVAWKKGSYGGKKGGTQNVVFVITSLIEDLEIEIKNSRKLDKEAQEEYEKDREDMESVLKEQQEGAAASTKMVAQLKEKMERKQAELNRAEREQEEQTEVKGSLDEDCGWIEKEFESRRQQRKAEIDGLDEAKSLLAGADKGNYEEVAVTGGDVDFSGGSGP